MDLLLFYYIGVVVALIRGIYEALVYGKWLIIGIIGSIILSIFSWATVIYYIVMYIKRGFSVK